MGGTDVAGVVAGIVCNQGGLDGFVCIGHQVSGSDADVEHTTGVDRASERLLVDGEGNHIARFEFTRNLTTDRGVKCGGLGGVDGVV